MEDKKLNKWYWPFPLWECLHSSSAVVLGYEVYGGNCPWVLDKIHDLLKNLSEIRYWILYRIHPKHKYHLVITGLEPKYWCHDTRMLYSCMALLGEYIEEMGGLAALDSFNKELRANEDNFLKPIHNRQADNQEEAAKIYCWWLIYKDQEMDEPDHHKEEEMLIRLMKIRSSLWI